MRRPGLALTAAEKQLFTVMGHEHPGFHLRPPLTGTYVMSPGDGAQLFHGLCTLKKPVAAGCCGTTASNRAPSGMLTSHRGTVAFALWQASLHASPTSPGAEERMPFQSHRSLLGSTGGRNEQYLGTQVINDPIYTVLNAELVFLRL